MRVWGLLLCLVAAPQGGLSEVQLRESGPGLVRPSETLSLTCAVSGYSITSSGYWWNWIRQSTGKGLEWIGYLTDDGTTTYSPSLKSRASISRDTSKNHFSLQLSSLTPEDTAIYYCARQYCDSSGCYYFDTWGPGTTVTVSSGNPSAPTLFPLVSCGSTDESMIALGCLARDFLPSTINFSWRFKNNSEVHNNGVQAYPSVLTEGRYMASSQLLLTSMSLQPGSDEFVVCNAKHSQGDRHVNVPITDIAELPPNVSVFIPPRDAFSSSGTGSRTSQLICQATGFSPKKVSVSWFRDGKPLKDGINTGAVETEPKAPGPMTYRITSRLTITESDWLNQNVFTCQVEHLGLSYQKNVSSVCGAATPTSIRIFTVPPSFAGMFLDKLAKLTCLVTDLGTYESLEISWVREHGDKLVTSLKVSESHLNGTFSAVGEASVFVEEWKSGNKFTCIVTHKDLPFPQKYTISHSKGGAKHPPSVYTLPPAKEQLNLRESASVTCLVTSFSPPDTFVQWQHKGQPVSTDKYVTSAPMPEPQAPGLYFQYSVLTVSEEEWNAGDSFTCVVGHEELPHSVTERTVDKTTGKPTLYNVSLILSDSAGTCY